MGQAIDSSGNRREEAQRRIKEALYLPQEGEIQRFIRMGNLCKELLE
jgi:hypothetical protein